MQEQNENKQELKQQEDMEQELVRYRMLELISNQKMMNQYLITELAKIKEAVNSIGDFLSNLSLEESEEEQEVEVETPKVIEPVKPEKLSWAERMKIARQAKKESKQPAEKSDDEEE